METDTYNAYSVIMDQTSIDTIRNKLSQEINKDRIWSVEQKGDRMVLDFSIK